MGHQDYGHIYIHYDSHYICWIPWHLIIIHIILYIVIQFCCYAYFCFKCLMMIPCIGFPTSYDSNTWPAKANKPWISLPKGLGVKLSIIEATEWVPSGLVDFTCENGKWIIRKMVIHTCGSVFSITRHMVLFVQNWGGKWWETYWFQHLGNKKSCDSMWCITNNIGIL